MMRVMGLKCVKMEDMEESIKKIEFFGRAMVPNHDTVIFFKTYLQIFSQYLIIYSLMSF